ncbi:MAG: cytochrome-c oxidase, cbb3-type subunit III [Lysobacterales bacterium]
MLSAFWNGFVIILTIGSVLGCWWLLMWTKGVSGRDDDQVGTTGHVWDHDLEELNNPLPRWWLMLFHITIIFSLVYMVLYPGLGNVQGVLGWTQLSQYDKEMAVADAAQQDVYAAFTDMTPEQLMASDEAMGIGRRLFANHCAMCHGSDGRGAVGFPNLTDNEWQWGAGYDNILVALKQGRQANMPPLGAALGEDGLEQVVAYVQSLSGQSVDAELAAAGEARFAVCIACHGVDGKGNPLLGAPDLTNDIWLYGGDADTITETITLGRNGAMPSHADILDQEQRRMVAAYVLSLSQGN